MHHPPISFSAKARRTAEQPISYLIAVAKANPQLISFAAGLVDPLTLPGEEVREIADRILSNPARARDALQYGTTAGDAPLRSEILKHLERLEGKPAAAMGLTADNILVTTGSQQALYMLADILLDIGDIVIVESPSYFVYAGALSSFGTRILGVPMDRDGMVVEELEKLLHRLELRGELQRVKAIYCQSYFQNPTGLTLSLGRRQRMVEVAHKYSQQHRIVIIEDAAYRELRYDGEALPSIKSFDEMNSHVVSCYTFDKPFAAGLKLGYVFAPPEVAKQLLEQKGNHDFGSSHLCQEIVLEALRDGTYQRHLADVHAGYRRKRNKMLAAMSEAFDGDPDIQWTVPDGGLYVWLSLPRGSDTSRHGGMFEAALREGVLYVPGEYCFCASDGFVVPQNHMRLCYAVTPIEQIVEGVARLARVVSRAPVAGGAVSGSVR